VKVRSAQEVKDKPKHCRDDSHWQRLGDEQKKGMTASEALAFFLRIDLRALKARRESGASGPGPDFEAAFREAVIAEIAMTYSKVAKLGNIRQ